jgi:glycosyltransferase involved in cell wall biosynthesis
VRILHVGWGFSPWRVGGLIDYAEDLMDTQVARGDAVAYFFSGRYYPYVSGPRLKRWRRRGVAMHEVINGPVIAGMEFGTRYPELDVAEPRLEAGFGRVLDAVRPDIVHIQELHGLPSSLIEVTDAAGVPTVMTLHDYGPLCATLRLFDANGRLCMRRDVGADCVARSRDAPLDPGVYVNHTINFEANRARALLGLTPASSRLRTLALRGLRLHAVKSVWRGDPVDLDREWGAPERRDELEAAFQRRRDVNVERLGKIGRLIAQSPRLGDIYRSLGVSGERMTVLPAPARHIEQLRPRRLESPPTPVTFATLNGCASASKGAQTVLAALRALRAAGLEGGFRLRVLGHVDRAVREELSRHEAVELYGPYRRDELDALLEDVDVGIVPSMWEEAYGYTGLELIAKGIPLIANPLGGIVQYAHEGRTAWLNASCSGEGLAQLIADVVRDPAAVVDMHRRVVAAREELVPLWSDHVDGLDGVYRDLLEGT